MFYVCLFFLPESNLRKGIKKKKKDPLAESPACQSAGSAVDADESI